jgi:hypothetical protein
VINVELIEDEFIEQVKKNIPDFKTVDVLEPEVLESELKKLMAVMPCCFVIALDEGPIEEERSQAGYSTLVEQRFMMLVGAASLRNRKEQQRGCYSLTRELKSLFEGNTFTIDGETTKPIVWYGRQYEFSFEGKAFYSVTFGIHSI